MPLFFGDEATPVKSQNMNSYAGFLYSRTKNQHSIVGFLFILFLKYMTNDTLNLYFNPLFKTGRWRLTRVPMIASVAILAGQSLYAVEDGTHTVTTNSTANFKGILMEAIAATDADYAVSMKLKFVAVPATNDAEAEFAVGAGTFTLADVGKSVVFSTSLGLAVDTSGIQARITRYLTATRGVCQFNQDIVA